MSLVRAFWIGFLRISIWSAFSNLYGPHWLLVAITTGLIIYFSIGLLVLRGTLL